MFGSGLKTVLKRRENVHTSSQVTRGGTRLAHNICLAELRSGRCNGDPLDIHVRFCRSRHLECVAHSAGLVDRLVWFWNYGAKTR